MQKLGGGLARAGDGRGAQTQDKSYKKGFKTLAAPAGAVVVLDATNGSVVAMASQPDFDPNAFVHGIPDADVEAAATTRRSDYPLLDRAIVGPVRAGLDVQADHRDRRAQRGRDHADQDDRRQGQVRVPDATRSGSSRTTRRALRPGGPARALTVSSDVYFYTIGGDLYYR